MFEIGKSYTIYEIDGEGLGFHSATVLDWQPPLLKVSHPNGGYAVHNTASQYFHRAELNERVEQGKFDVESLLA
ncbi:hypothetical protein ACQKGC_05250 [Allorhizobium pseudoryzae]|uniref:hypothetical protein n=1 Tax=Allorhizobium pseudoryzae TaxID=379684 RepID=UPI003D01DC3A